MRPTSAPRHEDIASGTRRKWGEPPRGEPKVTAAGREITGPEPAIAGQSGPCPVPLSDNLLQQIITRPDLRFRQLNLFDCAAPQSFGAAGAQRKLAMIETVTAVMGLVSAGIFLAHAFEGFRSRA